MVVAVDVPHDPATVIHNVEVPGSRPPTRATLSEAVQALRRVLEAVESGTLKVPTPRDVALLRRLQGVLAEWEEALGEAHDDRHHSL
jgi:hypothetical protein